MIQLIPTLALVSLLSTTVGPYVWVSAVTKLEEGADGIWTVQVYSGTKIAREPNGELSRVSARMAHTDAMARDPLTGRLILDELREALKSRELMYVRFHRNGSAAKITMVQHMKSLRLYLEPEPKD